MGEWLRSRDAGPVDQTSIAAPESTDEDEFVANGSETLCVRRWGDPTSEHVVFLLHGSPGCRLSIWPPERTLRELRVCVVTYDRPGYGGSSPRADRMVIDAAREVAGIADHFAVRTFGVVGRSGGGPHALACAAALSGRVTRVASLAGLAPPEAPNWYQGMNRANCKAFEAARTGRRDLQRHLEPLAARMGEDPHRLLTRTLAAAGDLDAAVLSDERYRDTILASYREALRSPEGWISDVLGFTRPWGFDPARIQVPVWLWHGARDVFVPSTHSRWLKQRIRHAVLTVDHRAGHFGALRKQASAIRWAAGQTETPDQLPTPL